MKLFISKLLKFFACWGIFLLFIYLCNAYLFKSVHQKTYHDYDTLILGDSHIMHLNEKMIPQSLNLSRAAENYRVAYHKLEHFSKIKKLDKVILGYSYHNLGINSDNSIKKNYFSLYRLHSIVSPLRLFEAGTISNISKVLSKYMLSLNDLYLVKYLGIVEPFFKSPIDKNTIFKKVEQYIEENTPFQKFSKKSKEDKLKLVHARINLLYNPVYFSQFKSELSTSYLEKIAALCQEKNIKLYLCNMPMYSAFREVTPKFYKEELEKLTEEIEKKYTNTKYINLETYFDDQPKLLKDQDHCTPRGAAIISDLLAKKYL